MRIMNRLLSWILIVGSWYVIGIAQGQPKIAVVNVEEVFNKYWKSQQGQKVVDERRAEIMRNLDDMKQKYQQLSSEYRQIQERANDPALSPEHKQKLRQDAERKLVELRQLEQDIRAFEERSSRELAEQIQRMWNQVMQDIQEAVAQRAKLGGYNLILDTAAKARNGAPIVIFFDNIPDLTQQIITQLNETAPARVTEDKK